MNIVLNKRKREIKVMFEVGMKTKQRSEA